MRGCQVLEDDVPGMCGCHPGGGVLAARPLEKMASNSIVAGPSDCRARCEIGCHDTSLKGYMLPSGFQNARAEHRTQCDTRKRQHVATVL